MSFAPQKKKEAGNIKIERNTKEWHRTAGFNLQGPRMKDGAGDFITRLLWTGIMCILIHLEFDRINLPHLFQY